MGTYHGKLIVEPAPVDVQQCEHSPSKLQHLENESASMLVNGDANAVSHIPPIDADAEPTDDKTIEPADALVPSHFEPNGTVTTTEEQTPTEKKHKGKNPITWMKRRLSRKSVSRHASEDATEDNMGTVPVETGGDSTSPPISPVKEETTEEAAKPSDMEVMETAGSLIDDVLTSVKNTESEWNVEEASSAQNQPSTPVEEPQNEPTIPIEESETVLASLIGDSLTETTHPVNDPIKCEPDSPVEDFTELVLGSPVASSAEPEVMTPIATEEEESLMNGNHEDTTIDEFAAVLDENNTNSAELTNGHVNHKESDYYKTEPDTVALKLAGLELTNGHSVTHKEEYFSNEIDVNGD